jgi:hypothetical protein
MPGLRQAVGNLSKTQVTLSQPNLLSVADPRSGRLSLKTIEEIYVAAWCTVMPITGTVLIPPIQGTVPAYMLALGSAVLIFFKISSDEVPAAVLRYLKTFLYVFLLWLLLLVGSQLGLMISGRHDFGGVGMITPDDSTVIMRSSLFTQSLYLVACVMTALYFRYFFQPRWMRYVYWGGYLLAGYGIYEWTYFLVFHQTGDFMANRTFGDHPASWSQGISFGGLQLLRIKSTLGEPTFFAAVVLPYLFLALDGRQILLSCLLLFTALFSTSTACYITLSTCLLVKSVWTGRVQFKFLSILLLIALFLGLLAVLFPETFRGMFIDKISGNNDSGASRIESTMAVHDLYGTFTIPNWIFGIGFGYVYLGIYADLLVNTGIIGLGAFLWVFLRPLIFLPTSRGYEGHKAGLLAIVILCGLSLSELFLPPTWMFIGLAYYKLEQYRNERWKARPLSAA